jgi:RsiW-degrading membrane proteinase PrsW (M82 family)
MAVLTALVAAVVPTAIYGLLLWWLDRYEKEPLSLLLIAFLWGAAPAILLAVLFEFVLALPFNRSPIGPDIKAVGVAPFVEEGFKALALAGLFLWARREFDGPLDGIVYGALIGFGFAMTENALYYIYYQQDVGTLFWVRGVFFGLNHAFFTSLVGLAVGFVRYRRGFGIKAGAFAVGLTLAVLFHAVHNLFVGGLAGAGVILSWIVQSSGVVVVLAVALLSWRQERRWMSDELGDEVRAGVISAGEYAEVVSADRRVRRQIHTLRDYGWTRFRQVRRLHHLLTELAFRKSQQRLADRHSNRDEPERLRREILVLREVLAEAETSY